MTRSLRPKLPWPDVKVPTYDLKKHGPWEVFRTEPHLMHGYFTPYVMNPPGYGLRRGRRMGKPTVWMSLTAMELESHMPHIAAATGTVVVAGLGMGMYLFNILAKPEVAEVFVLERDPQVIEMFHAVTGWRTWEGADKLEIIECNALKLDFNRRDPVDFLYADIWPTMGHANALHDTRVMCDALAPTKVGYWTQEHDFHSFWMECRREGSQDRPMPALVDAWVKSLDLPLIGPEWPEYGDLSAGASYLQASASLAKMNPAIAELSMAHAIHHLTRGPYELA